ncbi:hypothetical protein FOE78_08890 [Microlunatus elymi]|uniref:Uncharacterized protein n=1 Tax=Microlunatus elymi TaxID=2596828 RepID=A0A516PXU0_9ACTN|nr:hypothetical protein [Microlunatus elymi]QDP95998.1 hypothetical protein FOE78_08890 [Microlunatus elymi]
MEDFPADCPSVLGRYRVELCGTVPNGYVFYDALGSGLFDNAGFAYLPEGIPTNVDASDFETGIHSRPGTLVHVHRELANTTGGAERSTGLSHLPIADISQGAVIEPWS